MHFPRETWRSNVWTTMTMMTISKLSQQDMFLEVENMKFECELAFSACYSATSCWEGRWNDVEGSKKAKFQRGFLQQGARAGGSGLLRAQRCWHAVAWVGHSWCSRVHAGLYCSCAARSKSSWLKTAKLLWWKRKQIQEIMFGVEFGKISK